MSAKLFHKSLKFTTYLSLSTLLKYEFYCCLSSVTTKIFLDCYSPFLVSTVILDLSVILDLWANS